MAKKLNKKELARQVGNKLGITQKDALVFIDTFMDTVKEAVSQGNSIELLNFGTFYLWKRTSHLLPKRCTTLPDELQNRMSIGFKPGEFFLYKINKEGVVEEQGGE